MAFTNDEIQSVVSAVLSSLQTNSKTIDQLTAVETLGDSDVFEIGGGKKVTYKVLKGLIEEMEQSEHDGLMTIIGRGQIRSVSVLADADAVTLTLVSADRTVSAQLPLSSADSAGLMSVSDKAALSAAAADSSAALPRSVDIADLDGMASDAGTMLGLLTAAVGHTRYAVTYRGVTVGCMDMMSDNMSHVVTQTLETHYAPDEDGTPRFDAHNHTRTYRYWRSYNLTAADTEDWPRGSWSAWRECEPTAADELRQGLRQAETQLTDAIGYTEGQLRETIDERHAEAMSAVSAARSIAVANAQEIDELEREKDRVEGKATAAANAAEKAQRTADGAAVAAGEVAATAAALAQSLDMLERSVWPLDVTLTVSPQVIEVGRDTSVTASWTARRDGRSVLGECAVDWLSPGDAVSLDGLGSRTLTMSPASEGDITVSVKATLNGLDSTATQKVHAVYPSYHGTVGAGTEITAAAVTGLTKLLNATRACTRTGISLSDGRIVYAYPASMGALTSVKDGNNFETIGAYSRKDLAISGVPYYVYAMTEAATATGVRQTYA